MLARWIGTGIIAALLALATGASAQTNVPDLKGSVGRVVTSGMTLYLYGWLQNVPPARALYRSTTQRRDPCSECQSPLC